MSEHKFVKMKSFNVKTKICVLIKQTGGAAGGGGAARCSRFCGGRSRSHGMEPVGTGQLLWSAAGEHVCLRDEEAAPQSQSGNRDKPGRAGLNRPDVFCTGGLILSDAATQGLQHRSLITTDQQEHWVISDNRSFWLMVQNVNDLLS